MNNKIILEKDRNYIDQANRKIFIDDATDHTTLCNLTYFFHISHTPKTSLINE